MTASEQLQSSCPPTPPTNPLRIRNSEDTDFNIGDAPEDAENNEQCFDVYDGSKDENFQDP
jgi:hypothetical protein